ncbi:MAG TPA: hypothetical protein VGM43_10935 [Bryobacteraceae bacterium]|jgi:hypothetical protein
MTFRCEDLREHGLILVPADPPSALLHNHSGKTIVALELIWRRTTASGAEMNGSGCRWSNILPEASEHISDAVRSSDPIVSVTLAIGGVCFSSGEFIGSETSRLWLGAVAEAETWREIGSILRDSPGDVFPRIEAFTGPTSPPPAPRNWRGHALRRCARTVAQYRRSYGDEARERLISYVANELPEWRRL